MERIPAKRILSFKTAAWSHTFCARRFRGEGFFDITDSICAVGLRFKIDGRQVARETFEQEGQRLHEKFYGPDSEAFDAIHIPPDEFWALGDAKRIETVMLTLGG